MWIHRLAILLIVSLALSIAACEKGPPPGAIGATVVAENNRGVGLMGQFRYAEAREVFAHLVDASPELSTLQINMAIATLNRQQPGDERRALERIEALLAKQPDDLNAHYVAGLLRLYLGDLEQARMHFRHVVDADPEDAYAGYYLAQCEAQLGDQAQALQRYQRVMQQDPYLRSAYYGAFQASRQLGRHEEARALLDDYQRLANNPRSQLAEFKYTRMGPRAEAQILGGRVEQAMTLPVGELFAAPLDQPLPSDDTATTSARPFGITPVDLDGEAILITHRSLPGVTLLRRQPDGSFNVDGDLAFVDADRVNAALWGDFDNDGLVDLYLCRQGPNQLWRQVSPGQWMDVTDSAAAAGGDRDTVDGAFFDADHDGDLDLFLVNVDGDNELLNNNLDGSFRALAGEQGLTGAGAAGRQVLPLDLDGDRDLDIIVLNADAPHEIYLNDRLWHYRDTGGQAAFRNSPALAGLALDLDNDGVIDVVTVDDSGRVLGWSVDDTGALNPRVLWQGEPATGWAQLAASDLDGDGVQDLLLANALGWWALRVNVDGTLEPAFVHRAEMPLRGTTLVLGQPAQGMGVLAIEGDRLRRWSPGTGRHKFLALTFSGRDEQAESMRSNSSGIGTRVAVRRGAHWTLLTTLRNQSGPGQGLQPLAVGLGGAGQADFVAIDWSDGVFQSELALGEGKIHDVKETQRQLSSCPVLFAWNGEQYDFVSDLLGVGGIGYAIGPGEYAEPRPWENFLLPAGLLQQRDGHYSLKIGEPMEEAAYLDSLAIAVYDLPPGWHLVLDERMGIADPQPTGSPFFYRREVVPVEARNQAGDMLDRIARADGSAAEVGPLDRRFIGRLGQEHVLTLRFDEPLDAYPGRPLLLIDGWVEYPYSQTMFAAWQAKAGFEAPTLEAQGGAGAWHRVLDQFGYPAGMPRRMSLPLDGLPSGTRALRLRTNMEVYWDRISVAFAEPLPAVRTRRLSPVTARVAYSGFALRTTGEQRLPDYDYRRRSPFWDTRHQAGYYTRFGAALELLSDTDEAVAIIGPGEEVQAEFAAPPPAPAGWTRALVLEARGWAKDMDLFTRDGETVAPLPTAGRPGPQRAALHARFNTRYRAGY